MDRAGGSGAIVLDGALAALDCRLDRLVTAGDHVLALLEVEAVLALATRRRRRCSGSRAVRRRDGLAGRTRP